MLSSTVAMKAVTDLPRPRGLPLVGNLLQLEPSRFHLQLEQWAAELGPLFRFMGGPKSFLVLSDKEAIQRILKERPEGFTRLRRHEPVAVELGLNGVFSAEGERWRRHRRVWISSLNVHQLRGFHEQLAELTERLLRRWQRAAAAGTVLDPLAELMRYTVDVTMRFALGHAANTLEHEGEDVIQRHLNCIFPALGRRIAAPFPYWQWVRLPADRALDRALVALREEVEPLIAAARQRIADDPTRRESPGCFLEALLVAQAKEPGSLSDDDVFANAITVLLGGEDTTATTLAWLMHRCTERPEVYAALRAEADAQMGSAAVPRAEALPAYLPHTDSAINETLRLHPVAPLLAHTAIRDTEVLGVQVPRGTDVFLLTRAAAGAAPTSVPTPRFMASLGEAETTNGAGPGRAPSLPFGFGPRLCPGRNLALAEMRTVVLMLAKHFELEAVPGARPVRELFSFTLVPQHLKLRLKPRAMPVA